MWHPRSLLRSCLAAMMLASPAYAGPVETSCRFLEVLGQNATAELRPMMDEIADRWLDQARRSATRQMESLAEAGSFAGGSVFRTARLGDELEEHLVILRLAEGEVAGVRMRYEWTPDGMSFVSMDFKRKYSEYIATPMLQAPEPITCP